MKNVQAATALTLVSGVSAFWRMPCRSQSGIARMDPLVDPGVIADHTHTIHGGGNFHFNTTSDDLMASDCTSCAVNTDKSAYWTPTLHFMYSNGSTVMVPQVGGMLAYYLFYLDKVKAFPKGFQMLAGTRDWRDFDGPFPDIELSKWPSKPTDQKFLEQRALGFNCLNYDKDPEPSLYRHTMPNKTHLDNECKDGIRLELAFPSCGNGELDSDDHKSHVAYPSLVKEGNCPEGYDTHYPFLFFETIWATNHFAGDDGQFVLSHGDPTGSGYHGDFIMGWESEDFLQRAIDTCTSSSGQIEDCPVFEDHIQEDYEAAKCRFDVPDVLKHDDISGPRDGLPVDVPVQYGPMDATPYPCAGREGTPTTGLSQPTETYSGSAVAYSAADPSVTATAPGGIIVAKYSSGAETETTSSVETSSTEASSTEASSTEASSTEASSTEASSTEAASSTITASPSLSDASDDSDIIATSYLTQGNDIVELVIEEVDVTVTATAPQSTDANSKHRRHVHQHIHKGAAHH